MRLLVVYKDLMRDAERLVAEIGADAKVVACGGEREPSTAVRLLLEQNPGASIILVGVRRHYQRALANYDCSIAHALSTVLGARNTIREWLMPSAGAASEILQPSEAFLAAAKRAQNLIIGDDALICADDIRSERFNFVNKAASALADYALSPEVASQGFKLFFEGRHVGYATSGQVEVIYNVSCDGKVVATDKITELHLKEGDRTDADDAPRVYFDTYRNRGRDNQLYVLVLRCGPHPRDSFRTSVNIRARL
jgi:hypothetical protein